MRIRGRRPSLALAALALTVTPGVGLLATSAPSAAVTGAQVSTCATGITAHRGSHDSTHTENTRRSALQAVANGADTVEGDLQYTSNGVWVLMHDATLDRTTNGTGAVSSRTWAQVAALRTDDGVKGGVPSLTGFLQAMQDHPEVGLQLEIKASRLTPALMLRLLQKFAEFEVAPRLLITSYNGAPLTQARSYSKGWHTALISNGQITPATTKKYGSIAIVAAPTITASYVRGMHAQGLEVYGWVADSRTAWNKLVAADVDAITTNDVRGATSWCAD